MHCFTESIGVAKQALDLGFYISFSGIVTFKNALQIKETCKYVPFDRMLIETDSPYLAPVPYRGKTNEPGYVSYVASYIASLKDSNVEEVGRVTSDNFYQLFNVSA
jgi:TatD DNase family protein